MIVREREIEKNMLWKLRYSVRDPATKHQAFPSVTRYKGDIERGHRKMTNQA